MELRWVRPLKGFLICIAFIGMALAIQIQPSTGVVLELRELGVSTSFVSLLFLISAAMSLITGLSHWKWNAMWVAVFIFYTIVSWAASYRMITTPTILPVACTLLSCFLILDIVHDIMVDTKWMN